MKAGQGESSMIRMVKRLYGPPLSYPDHLQEQNEQLFGNGSELKRGRVRIVVGWRQIGRAHV